MAEVPEWFWEVLDTTRPSLLALERWLGDQPGTVLVEFARAYLEAAEALADYAQGVVVDGFVWSEDSTEDLCLWVVGQGRDLWHAVVAGELTLAETAGAYLGRPSPLSGAVTPWDQAVAHPGHRGSQSPDALVHAVHRTRFAADLHALL
jgi:hypothetical protein